MRQGLDRQNEFKILRKVAAIIHEGVLKWYRYMLRPISSVESTGKEKLPRMAMR